MKINEISKNPNDYIGLVSGNTWKCKMFNGSTQVFWTPFVITSKMARKVFLYLLVDIYYNEDIEYIWKTKGIKS